MAMQQGVAKKQTPFLERSSLERDIVLTPSCKW
jgi:hypothetical protein